MKHKLIYADNAATTKLSALALEAMLPYLKEEFGNASQPYISSRSSKRALKESRIIIANCIGALPDEIFFTSCGTESDNWAIYGALIQQLPIVTSSIEHHAILRPCEYAANRGNKVTLLPVSSTGLVDMKILSRNLQEDCGLVSIMFANNEIGTIQSINDLANETHKKGWIFHSDAVQAVGHIPIDVHKLGVDLLSASAHKFNGPKGIGFLYIKKGLKWPSLILGGSQEKGHRAGTENIAAIVGMATALQENVDSIDHNSRHLKMLETRLLEGLRLLDVYYHRNGDNNHLFGNISLSFPFQTGEALLHRMDLLGISISTGAACNSETTQISHVLNAIGLDKTLANGTIRISLGKENTLEDVDIIISTIKKILSK